MTVEPKCKAIEPGHKKIPIYRQCELLRLNRSSLYDKTSGETEYNEQLMELIDKQYIETPFYGIDKMTAWLCRQVHCVNHKRVRRLMRQMGLEAVYPHRKRGLSVPDKQHRIYPYLLEDELIGQVDQGWSIYSHASRLDLSFSYNGLVQPLCFVLGSISNTGIGFLYRSIETCVEFWHTADIQYGSGQPVHLNRIYENIAGCGYQDPHGRAKGEHLIIFFRSDYGEQ